MVVEEEEKCVGNAEKVVDDALAADTSNMLCLRSFRTPLGPHTVSGGGEDGGCEDDRDDDDEH